MADALERVLQLVADGRLTAEEAAPLLDALDGSSQSRPADARASGSEAADAPASVVRIEVRDAGRQVINLRVPLALGRSAIDAVPGMSEATSQQIRAALNAGIKGPVLDLDDGEGDSVRVVIE